MRSHPVAGVFFFLLGLALAAVGILGRGSPGPLAKLPLPADVVVPFVMFQLAVWSVLFGVFFLRPRGRAQPRKARFAL